MKFVFESPEMGQNAYKMRLRPGLHPDRTPLGSADHIAGSFWRERGRERSKEVEGKEGDRRGREGRVWEGLMRHGGSFLALKGDGLPSIHVYVMRQ